MAQLDLICMSGVLDASLAPKAVLWVLSPFCQHTRSYLKNEGAKRGVHVCYGHHRPLSFKGSLIFSLNREILLLHD